jgi:hypothetical protein
MGRKAQGHCTIMPRNGWADIPISEELRGMIYTPLYDANRLSWSFMSLKHLDINFTPTVLILGI